jgi:hypothetical protein
MHTTSTPTTPAADAGQAVVDPEAFRAEIRVKYAEVATNAQFADIAVGTTVAAAARCDIGLWTDCVAGSLALDEWTEAIAAAGLVSVAVGSPTATVAGAACETRAGDYRVFGHTFREVKP